MKRCARNNWILSLKKSFCSTLQLPTSYEPPDFLTLSNTDDFFFFYFDSSFRLTVCSLTRVAKHCGVVEFTTASDFFNRNSGS